MNRQNPSPLRSRDIPVTYRVMRAIVRLGIWLFFPRLRLLNKEKLDQAGPSILLITHPQSLPVALLLIAAVDRQVHCLLTSRQLHGTFRKLAGWALGMQAFDSLAEEQGSWLNPCLSILANQGIIALFAGHLSQNDLQQTAVADFAARLIVETNLPGHGEMQPVICPVHWFLRTEHRGSEPLIYVDGPIQTQPFLPKIGENLAEAPRRLAETVQDAIGKNVFSLAGSELERFGRELEVLSREYLEQQWSLQPDWKQRAEDLQLSSLARKWIDVRNRTDPARLVELRESLDAYHEARRQCSMGQLIVENSGAWPASNARVAAAWIETVLGLPVTLYGVVNHFPAGIVLSLTGLFKNSPKRDPKAEWLLRIFIVLSFYTAQIFLVHLWWGRAAAGYYTLTLPVSGAYLWRYRWLLRRRTHVLLLKVLLPLRLTRLTRKREKILRTFEREFERSPQSPGMPYQRSPDLAE